MAVKQFHKDKGENEAGQLFLLVEMLRSYYKQEGMSIDVSKKYEDKKLEAICLFATLTELIVINGIG